MIKSNQLTIFVIVLSVILITGSHIFAIEHSLPASDKSSKTEISALDRQPYVVGSESKEILKKAAKENTGNYAIRYYLGMTALKEGNYQEAIELLEEYLALAPVDEISASVRERVTLLKIEMAERQAKLAAMGKQPAPFDKNTVAVFYFDTGVPTVFHNLSKGLTAMIITDLSQVPALTVVEREKIQAFIQEITLGNAKITDERSQQDTGKFLMAANVVQGTLKDMEKEKLDISALVTETANGSTKGNPAANGPKTAFFELEKQLVLEIIESLGISKDDLTEDTLKAIEKVHTKSFDAFVCFSRGLDFMDAKQFAEARIQFERALLLDPQFGIAKDALLGVPRTMASFNDATRLEIADLYGGPSDEEVEGFSKEPVNNNLKTINPASIRRKEAIIDSTTDESQKQNVEGDSTLKISW